MSTRQLVTALIVAFAAFFAYQYLISWIYPRRTPPTASQPAPAAVAPTAPTASAPSPAAPFGSEPAAGIASAPVPATEAAAEQFQFAPASSVQSFVLGGAPHYDVQLSFTSRGAAVQWIRLTTRNNEGKYVYNTSPGVNEPYEVVKPVKDSQTYDSFATYEIRIREFGDHAWHLADLPWTVARQTDDLVEFTTTLRSVDGDRQLIRLTKSYTLVPDKPLVDMRLAADNLSDRPLTIKLTQDAAVGIPRESSYGDMRRVMAAKRSDGTVQTANKAETREKLRSRNGEATPVTLFTADPKSEFAWTALTDRFFGVFIRPLDVQPGSPDQVVQVEATAAAPQDEENQGDLLARMTTEPVTLAPQQQASYKFEIYAGPKDPEILAKVNPAFTNKTEVYYTLAHAADQRCCTFEPLPQIMIGLLHGIHYVLPNYGIAIIILVLLIRTLLHPLSVYQQKSMYRFQEKQARLQPKLEAIKAKYPNDRARQQQETMKVYNEEGVNPMGVIVNMLPMLIQMPILVALWTGLNTDIALRHASLDGYWINNLAAPDALITFSSPITIPILAQLPLLGRMFQNIPSLNLLPILMGVSMWLQQKYMPKPGMQAKRDAAKQRAAAERKPGQPSPEDQLRQQQMMMYASTFIFPLMFYYLPSGLNLYWMASNVFGIFESLIIRKQLEQEKQRTEREGPKGPKKPGWFSRKMKALAEQMEEIQKRADQLQQEPGKSRRDKGGRNR
jgi:YidC/Oxa1 family membrane protein insertase